MIKLGLHYTDYKNDYFVIFKDKKSKNKFIYENRKNKLYKFLAWEKIKLS